MTPTRCISDLASQICSRWSMPHLSRRIRISRKANDVAIVIESDEMWTNRMTIRIDDDLVGDILRNGPVCQNIRLRISEFVRLEARAERMKALGLVHPPGWSVSIAATFLDVLEHAGVDEDQLIGLGDYSEFDDVALDYDRTVMLRSAAVRSGRLVGIATLRFGTHEVVVRALDSEDGGCQVRVNGLDLPATLVAAMPGLPLGDVLSHPMMSSDPEITVRQARYDQESSTLVLHLEPAHRWCGALPRGMDASWRDIREGRLLPEA